MSIDIRPGTPADHRAMAGAMANALLSPTPDDAAWEKSAPSWLDAPSFGAWDGDECVGSASQFLVDTTVPGGGRLPTGAVSRVGVLPTHRRRGVATRLLRALVDDARERGLALMSLRASEATIYERYGFGMAGEYVSITVDPARARPVSGAEATGRIRFVAPDEVLATVESIYDASLHRRAGMVTRPASWWRRYLADALVLGTASHVVVHEREPGRPDGYAHYDLAWNEGGPGLGGGRGTVHDVIAVDDATELALWGFLLDIDLVRTWQAGERPVDDIVRDALRDRRAYAVTAVDDEQWLRIVDVDRALRARTYAPVPGSVTVTVEDPWIGSNCGTWRIAADGAERVEVDGELRAGIAALSAAYLGGTSWRSLAATGRVAGSTAAIERADALVAARPLPFCGSFF